MSKKLIYSILLIAVFAGSAQAQFITSIVHRNGGAPEQPEIAPNPLDEDELTFVDRTHQYNDIPESVLGAQYVKLANDDKGISAYELDVTMAANATLYIFVDNRMGSSDGGMGVDPDITGMSWLTDMGFEDTGDDIGIDESGDGDIDQYSSVFSMPVLAGTTITLRGNTEGHGGNMYGVAALGPKFKASNPVPADGALYEGTWVNLGWSPGDTAVSHDVYLGDNFDDVNDGTADTFRGNQTSTDLFIGFIGYPYPDGLVPGTTYYWRIDEVEADGTTIYKGNVWSFTIPSRIAYNPDPADGARYVDPNVELNWTAGLGAEFHYVYFGDNFDDVNSAVEGLLLADTTYTPGPLELDKTYYWRVDESADAVTMLKGDVWSFSTVPDIPITDPNLLCWWKFDEGSDTTAVDYSGHNNHGTLMDDPQWVDGQVGGALEFGGDGDHVVDEDAENYLNGLNALTVCIWVKSDVTGTNKGFINGEVPDGGDNVCTMRYDSEGGNGGGTNVLKMAVTTTEDEQQLESSNNAQTTEWQHYSMVWSSGQQLEFYINGVLDVPTDNQPATTGTTTGCSALIIGKGSKDEGAGAGWDGLIDDVRIYNKVLTADDITQVMRGEPDLAWNPKPAKGSTAYIGDATPLSWSAGENASQHDVYFGIDKDVVADANTSTTDIYRGRQFGTSYTPPEVEWGGGPYYWRIDEYNTDATISTGRIWSFTVADFIVIEDFEDYNDFEPDRIFDVWLDGWGVDTNGSEVGYADPDFDAGEHHIETNIVHGGEQSMPYFYDNNFKYSEATYSPTQRNWTEEGVGVLSLWFRGNPAGLLEGPAGTYTMTGAGADIWGTADEFRYAWKQLSGDGSIVAQVLSVENTDPWAKVGVMIRNTLDADSANAMAYFTPDGRVGWQYRVTAGDSSSSTRSEPGAITTPHWVKLTRQGNTITAQHSSDGVNWEDMVEAANPQEPSFTSILMNQSVYIGLALTSHSSGVTCVAEFSDVETTGAVSPPTWTHEAIGATMAANDPARMYVALNGGTAVYHVNPNAALIDTWTEWTIDLQEFETNLFNVSSIAIGFGDKNNLQPGGTGMVLFDDIRLYRPAEPQP